MSWEKRWHPLREEWVTITSHRNTRPWSGANVTSTEQDVPDYDEKCYLCPGNTRISGITNALYDHIFVFDNDHPSFSADAPLSEAPPGIYKSAPAKGACRVICYSPKHNLTLAELNVPEVHGVLSCWAEQTRELAARDNVASVLVFENKGEVVGVSNPHPHCQIYATDFVFSSIETEFIAMQRFEAGNNRNLVDAIIETEQQDGRRIICEANGAIAFVPWFARFPYECYVVPKEPAGFLHELDADSLQSLASLLRETLARLDNLWQMSFPYMLIVHQAPCDGRDVSAYRCHIQIHPPLRAPGLQKFLAGVETGGGNFLNDASPEEKAAELRAVLPVHYNRA